jgi:MFS transporter, ACS family, D-galactonate transporter
VSHRRWAVVAVIFFGILISYIDRGNLSIAASPMMKDFGLPPGTMGLLLSAFFITYAAFQIPAGAIVDKFGIRRVYAAAFFLWSIASASIALARGTTDVMAMRMLLGFGEAVGPIASLSFIRRNFSGPEQGLPTAIYVAGQSFGPAIGTLLGSILVEHVGWRTMFAVTGLGALIWLPFWLWLAPRDGGAVKPTAKLNAPAAAPIPWGAVLGSRAFWGMTLCIFLSSYYWYFVLTWVPTYLTSARGYSNLQMGRVLSTPLFIMAFFNIAAGVLADRIARRTGNVFRTRLAFSITGHVCSSVLLLLLVSHDRALVFPILLVAVCAPGMGNSNFWAISQHAPPPHMVGRTIGYLNTVSQMAGFLAPLVTGWILGPKMNFDVAITIAGICPLLAAASLLMAGPRGLQQMKDRLSAA